MAAGFKWRGDEAIRLVKKAGFAGLLDGADFVLTESIKETPLLSGTLRRSGLVTPIPNEQAAIVSYNTPYAVRQHEDLGLQHTDGKAKYLEDPFNKNKPKILKLVQTRVKQALDRAR